ncbi:hypothetical protein [Saccharopolyspora sp. NPDC049426]|uniref:Rv1733c family protein n=1 Tax=Saccharopolyspora sp. NPDC049426 TaxID=3155652 RepID=UPI00344AD680
MRCDRLSAGAHWLGQALRSTPNPLRRRLDRLTAILVLGLLLMALAVPAGAIAWGEATYAANARAAAEAVETRRPVEAAVIAPPTTQVVGINPDIQTTTHRADVRWVGVDGTPRIGNVEVGRTTATGGKVVVWVDDADRVVAAPLTAGQLRASEIAFIFWLVTIGEALCAALMVWVHRVANARAQCAWSREWEIVGPKWTRQQY